MPEFKVMIDAVARIEADSEKEAEKKALDLDRDQISITETWVPVDGVPRDE